jgi:hypothetical protein
MPEEKKEVVELELPKSVFETLNKVNVSGHVEKLKKVSKKTGAVAELSYLSWAWAWGELKKRYPTASYKVYENEQGWNYFTDGRTAWVKVSVTVEGEEIIEYLPVMDNSQNALPLEQLDSLDVTRAIQRAVTKAIGRHGLGLYIYAGEDLPTDTEQKNEEKPVDQPQVASNVSQQMRESAQLFNVSLMGLATYLKKPISELTDEDVKTAIEMKRAAREKKQ